MRLADLQGRRDRDHRCYLVSLSDLGYLESRSDLESPADQSVLLDLAILDSRGVLPHLSVLVFLVALSHRAALLDLHPRR